MGPDNYVHVHVPRDVSGYLWTFHDLKGYICTGDNGGGSYYIVLFSWGAIFFIFVD